MISNVNNKKKQKNHDYPNTMKKSIPISIVNGGDTIFIKTNPNKLTYNYINNGNQIKNNKFFINSINQSSDINQSLKNTFSLQKSNFTKSSNGTIIEAKNINTSKLHELIKIKKLPNMSNTHYRGTNSFIKMNRKKINNYSNISSKINNISKNNSINSNNHIFNFYNFINKMNSSLIKGKNKVKNKLEKNKEIIGNVNKKKIFNFTSIIDRKSSKISSSTLEKTTVSKGKRQNTSINKSSNTKNYKCSNNNLTNINFNNKDYLSFATIVSEKDSKFNNIKDQLYYPGGKYNFENKKLKHLNKYIYSMEKKKEKSLAEKRHIAKKPISYLLKNNLMNHLDKSKNIKNNIIININNINNGIVSTDFSKEKDKIQRLTISTKRNNFDLSNSNFYSSNNRYEKIKNYETENKIRIKKNGKDVYSVNTHDFLNKNSCKNKKIPFSNNKSNLCRSNTIESKVSSNSNIVNNNNYYNINNTFIFDTAGQKILQYDLTKIIPNSKNNNSMNINISDISNLQSRIYKVCKNDIEKNDTSKNNKNKIIKKENKIITKDNNANKNNHNYINVVINNKNQNNFNIQKYSSYKLSNIIKNKINHNHTDIISNYDKIYLSNMIKKESNKNSNNNYTNKNRNNNSNNFNINNNITKEFIIKEYNNKKTKESEKYKTLINNKKDNNNNSLIKKNKFHEQKSITSIYNNHHNSLYVNTLNKKKSDNISNLEQKIKITKYNINNIIDNSLKNTTNNSVQKDKNKITKDNNKDNTKDKDKSKEKIKELYNNKKIKDNKIITCKIMNIKKNKNNNFIINVNNSQKLRAQKIKKDKCSDKNGNKKVKERKSKTKSKSVSKKEEKEKHQINNININNIFFNDLDNFVSNNENISIDTFDKDNMVKKDKEKNKKEKNYTSFELISLSENKINDDDKFTDIDVNNELFIEDNFDDINTIIRKIDFYSVKDEPQDIFSLNNNKYKEYNKIFNKRFNNFIKNSNCKLSTI